MNYTHHTLVSSLSASPCCTSGFGTLLVSMHLACFVTHDFRHAIVALQTQLSPPISVAQPMQRLGSNSAKVPQFQAAATSSGQIPLLAPPPLNSPGVTPRQLSGVPGGM